MLWGVSRLKFSHLDEKGRAQMVDITQKKSTSRVAKAYGRVKLSKETYDAIREGNGPKGDIFSVAKIAGIMAAKKTHELIPLCHPLSITHIDVDYRFNDHENIVEIISTVKTTGQTGVEMEALVCVTHVGLTVYDMCKAIDKSIELEPFYLLQKEGGKSGRYERKE